MRRVLATPSSLCCKPEDTAAFEIVVGVGFEFVVAGKAGI